VLVTPADTVWVLTVGALIFLWQAWWRRGFLFASLDPEGARVRGLPVVLLDGLLMVSVAVLASIATRALGALPVFAFSVLPALAAVAVARSPGWALVIATVLGLVAGAGGYVLAFFYELPVGASQTFLAAAGVLVALVLRGIMGLWPSSKAEPVQSFSRSS
jgi:zinc transport system permease protein